MPGEMGVSWDFASTTMALPPTGARHVCAGPQSADGAQPPQVPPHPLGPQTLPVQSALQLGGPPSELPPEDEAPEEVPDDAPEPAPDDVPLCAPEPVLPLDAPP